MVEWKEIFGRHGMIVSLEKTEVPWVGHQIFFLYRTGWEETEPKIQLCTFGWSCLRRRRHREGNSH